MESNKILHENYGISYIYISSNIQKATNNDAIIKYI